MDQQGEYPLLKIPALLGYHAKSTLTTGVVGVGGIHTSDCQISDTARAEVILAGQVMKGLQGQRE